MSKVSESETLIGHKRSHKDKKKHHKKHKKHHRKDSSDEENPEVKSSPVKVLQNNDGGKATPVNEMTSSSSSGSPATQTQELENLSKASPRKVVCPPYRGIGFDFSHYTRIMLSEMG
jgi:hypothetical protein